MFGSDWPVSTALSQTDYRSWFQVVVDGLGDQEQIDVLGGTASRWYRIPGRELGATPAAAAASAASAASAAVDQHVSRGKVPIT